MTWVAELRGRPTMGGLRLTPGAVGNFGKDVAFLLAVAKMHNPRWLISPKPTVEWGSVFVNWDEASDMLGYVCEVAIDSGRELSLFGDEEARRNPTGSSAERRRIGTAGPMEAWKPPWGSAIHLKQASGAARAYAIPGDAAVMLGTR